MSKALRLVSEKLKYVDIVLELRDARIPYASSNPKIDEIIKKKPRLILLNKANMADRRRTDEWMAYYKEQGIASLPIDCITGFNIDKIVSYSKEILKDVLQKEKEKGLKERPIKAMIIGIPNVGKSTLINILAKRKVAKTGDRPGITKTQQWININNQMMLLDTPGVLWPKFEDQIIGLRLAVTGAIKDDILHLDDIAIYALNYLRANYPKALEERFKLEEIPEDNIELMEMIGRKRGALLPGNRVNFDKVIDLILHELRNDLLGRLTFETPQDIEEMLTNLAAIEEQE
jgi:ribosome biogenesis GTPase A